MSVHPDDIDPDHPLLADDLLAAITKRRVNVVISASTTPGAHVLLSGWSTKDRYEQHKYYPPLTSGAGILKMLERFALINQEEPNDDQR